jgi:RNA polymerase sigma factor (TIGR02999 family)
MKVMAMTDVTQILLQIEQGDPSAAEQLLPLVYDELRKLAAAKLASERPGQTLQATALVHEAYLRLVGQEEGVPSWDNRGHFFAAAAEAMRRILVEQARRKKSRRRGGDRVRLDLDQNDLPLDFDATEAGRILAVHEALTELEAESPRKAQLVKLRFFAGMTLEEAAGVLDVAVPTAKRDWAAARVWLYRRMSDS